MRIHLEVYHRKVSSLTVCPPRREPHPGRALLFWKRAHPSPNLEFSIENTEAVNSEGSQRVPEGLGCVAHRQTLQRTGLPSRTLRSAKVEGRPPAAVPGANQGADSNSASHQCAEAAAVLKVPLSASLF